MVDISGRQNRKICALEWKKWKNLQFLNYEHLKILDLRYLEVSLYLMEYSPGNAPWTGVRLSKNLSHLFITVFGKGPDTSE